MPQRRQALERLVLHATSLRIPVVEVEGGSLTAIAGFDGHQGIALVVEPRTWAGVDDVLARAAERGEPPFVLVLDSLEDPQNVGTLLRSAEAAGVHGVLFPTHRQAPLTPAAVKASAGAVEHLLLCPVDDLPAALSDLRLRGLRITAAEADAPLTASEADLRGPLAIVVGSEGGGLSPAVRRRADLAVRIPMRGAIGSLNAAVAGSILLFAAVAQRDLPERPVRGGDHRDLPASAVDDTTTATAAEAEGAEGAEPTAADVAESEPAAVTGAETRPAKRRSSTPRKRKADAEAAEPAAADVAESEPAAVTEPETPPTKRRSSTPRKRKAEAATDQGLPSDEAQGDANAVAPEGESADGGSSHGSDADGSDAVDDLLPGGPAAS